VNRRDLDVHPFELPLRRPWGTIEIRRGVLIRRGDAWGEAAELPQEQGATTTRLAWALRAGETEGTWPTRPAARHAMAQLRLTEEAVAQGRSLGALLGQSHGRRPRGVVDVNATLGIASVSATVQEARRAVRAGSTTIKLKIGANAAEIRRVEAVRNAVGGKIRIRLDANGAWDARTAMNRLAELQRLEIEYVEQPLPPGHVAALARLAARSPVPVVPDEDARSPAAARRLIRRDAFELIVLKPMVLGGPDIAAGLLVEAEDAGVRPIITDVVESGVGRAAALHVASLSKHRAAHGLGSGVYLRHDLVDPTLVPARGMMHVPTGPGLGLRVRTPTAGAP
jgi:L-alanine-DL-glutamate epimerase-like enolase superfamily enzyme